MKFKEIKFSKENLKVKDLIKKVKKNYHIASQGKILAICNDSELHFCTNIDTDEVLNMTVKKILNIEGVVQDRIKIVV